MATMSRREMEFLLRFRADASQAVNRMRTQLQGAATATQGLNRNMAQAANQANNAMRNASNSAKQARTNIADLSGEFRNLKGVMATLGASLFANTLIDVTRQTDRMTAKLQFTFGSMKNVNSIMAEMKAKANSLGVDFVTLTSQFASFAAASQATGLSLDTLKSIFFGVADAGTALQLSADDMKGVFFAIQQMMSKGKVNSEEFRLQLAERLPVALTAATRALKVTTAEFQEMLNSGQIISSEFLPKFAEELRKMSAGALVTATQSLNAEFGKLGNTLTEFFQKIGESGFASSFKNVLKSINEAKPALMGLAENLGTVLDILGGLITVTIKAFVALDNMTGNTMSTVLALGLMAGVLGQAIRLFLSFTGVMTAFSAAATFVAGAGGFGALITALGAFLAATWPVLAIIAAVVAAIAGLNYAIQKFTGINILGKAFDWLKGKVMSAWSALVGFLKGIGDSDDAQQRYNDAIKAANLQLAQYNVNIGEVADSTNAVKNEAELAEEQFRKFFGVGEAFDDGDLNAKLQNVQRGFENTKEALSNLFKEIESHAAARGTKVDLTNLVDLALTNKNGQIGIDPNAMRALAEFRNQALILPEEYDKIMEALFAAARAAGNVSGEIDNLRTEQDNITAAGGRYLASLRKTSSDQTIIVNALRNSGASLKDMVAATEAYKNAPGEFDISDPSFASKLLEAGRLENTAFDQLKEQFSQQESAVRKAKQERDKVLEELANNKYRGIFIELLPESKKMVAEAQADLAEVEKFYEEAKKKVGKLTVEQEKERLAIIDAYQKRIGQVQVEAAKKAAEESIENLRKSEKVSDQARAAIEQFRYDAQYKTGQLADFFGDAFDRATDVIADFVTTGKADIGEFVAWAAKELAKIALREAAASAFSSSSGGIGGFLASIFHSGGVVGQATRKRMVDPMMFVNAPRFHKGLMPDEFPAILQRGETVIPRGQSAVGGGSVNIPINVVVKVEGGGGGNGSGKGTTDDAQRIGAYVADAVSTKFYDLVAKEKRPGGQLANYNGRI